MTKEDIIRMAREAGIIHPEMVDKTLERFAALVAAAERKVWADEFAGLGEWTCVNIIEGTLGEVP